MFVGLFIYFLSVCVYNYCKTDEYIFNETCFVSRVLPKETVIKFWETFVEKN